MIPINKPQIDQVDVDAVLGVLDDGNLTSAAFDGGRRVQEFENQMRKYLNVKHLISVNSGTSALFASLLAGGIGYGHEVILPSFTFVATANAIAATGARPIFVDILKEDFTIDPHKLKSRITGKTKAVVPVHLYGHLAHMDEILEIANQNSLLVVEDSCQSVGSTYFGKHSGSIGDMGCFSMYASKVLTSGEGGAIATDNDLFAEKLRMIRNHGMVEGYDTRILGFNLRLSEMSAALATSQLKNLTQILQIRKRNAKLYYDLLSVIPGLEDLEISLPIERNQLIYNWYLYTVTLPRIRDEVKIYINDHGIGATVYYDPPAHLTPYYKSQFPNLILEATEYAARSVLSLPVHQLVSEKDVELICNKLRQAIYNNV